MATADETYKLLLYATAKNKSGGYVSPADFAIVYNQAQKSFVGWLLGTFQQYTPGRPVARVEFGQNEIVRQRLTPSIYQYNLAVDITGFSPYPGDFLNVDAMWSIYGANTVSIYNYNRVRFAQQNYVQSYLKSVIDPVATNPIYLIEDRGFRFFPTNLNSARLSYVRQPPDVVWGYTDDANGRPVYSQARSTDPIWDDIANFDIICRALALIGVNLQSSVLLQYSQEIKNSGQ